MASKERYATRKAAGKCTACGIQKAECGTRCKECYDKENKYRPFNRYKERTKLKNRIYLAYGGYICNCCGETEPLFLTIDHVNNDGANHRRELSKDGKAGDSQAVYRWIEKNNYPIGFQILCHNCNSGKFRNGGICPHKIRGDKPIRPSNA